MKPLKVLRNAKTGFSLAYDGENIAITNMSLETVNSPELDFQRNGVAIVSSTIIYVKPLKRPLSVSEMLVLAYHLLNSG